MSLEVIAIGLNFLALLWAIFEFRSQKKETRKLLLETKKLEHKVHLLATQVDLKISRLNRLRELILQAKEIHLDIATKYLQQQSAAEIFPLTRNFMLLRDELHVLISVINDPSLNTASREISKFVSFAPVREQDQAFERDIAEANNLYLRANESLGLLLKRTHELLEEASKTGD